MRRSYPESDYRCDRCTLLRRPQYWQCLPKYAGHGYGRNNQYRSLRRAVQASSLCMPLSVILEQLY